MALVTVTASQLKATSPLVSTIIARKAAVAVTKGQTAVLQSGGVNPANDADGRFDGVVLDDRGANEMVDILVWGPLAGLDLSGLNEGDPVYLATTDGRIDDSAVTPINDVIVGRVHVISDGVPTKVLMVNALSSA